MIRRVKQTRGATQRGRLLPFDLRRRLLEPIGYVPPAEYEARYYEQVRQDTTIANVRHAGALGGILSPASQSLAQAADRLHDFL